MKKLILMGVVMGIVLTGCKDDESTDPDQVLPKLKVNTILSGAKEVPANASTATGSVEGTLDQDSGILKLAIMYSDSAVADSTMSDSLIAFIPTAWHIHEAPADSAGPVVINLGSTFASPYDFTDTLTTAEIAKLVGGRYYINIHTAKYPAGEIRGQLATAAAE